MVSNHENYQQFGIPTAQEVDYTYVSGGASDDDLIATATYKNSQGTILGVLTFTYVGSTNNILSIVRSS
jgi:hypothetical protein